MSSPHGTSAGRYLRTVRHLRPEQIVHRLRLRAQQAALTRWPSPFERRWIHEGGASRWPSGFAALDAQAPPLCGAFDDLERGTFTFLNEARALGDPVVWDPPGASQLWSYHQHYWEWAWTLLAHPDRGRARNIFAEHFESWLNATTFGRWNAWAPYPASLRTWVLVNIERDLARGTRIERPFHHQLRLHAGFVARNLELDVGGNHLMKNLKALISLGIYFGDQTLVDQAARRIEEQVSIQVLDDGGHFELSPSYHCQVLGDLIDVGNLLEAAGQRPIAGVTAAVRHMRAWLGAVLMPDGDVPMFNDCQRVGATRIAALRPGPRPERRLTVLPDSGYVVAAPGTRLHLVADVGHPCPPDLPAHAQADCLSFELAIDGERVVVDPGTSIYEAGSQRAWERSTRAHNTVTVDDADQTEVWGSFRAGRLARATLHEANATEEAVEIVASHTGYSRLEGTPVHRRRWLVTPDAVEITDSVAGAGSHRVRSHLLLAADHIQVDGSGLSVSGRSAVGRGFTVELPQAPGAGPVTAPQLAVRVAAEQFAVGFGDRRDATALVSEGHVRLPVTLHTSIRLSSRQEERAPAARPATHRGAERRRGEEGASYCL